MDSSNLIRMANQIADFFKSYPEAEAVSAVENHVRLYWDPRMRKALQAHVATGGAGLSAIALAASKRIN